MKQSPSPTQDAQGSSQASRATDPARAVFVRDFAGVTGMSMLLMGVALALIGCGQGILGWLVLLVAPLFSTAYYRRQHQMVTSTASIPMWTVFTLIAVFLGLLVWLQVEHIDRGAVAPEALLGAAFLAAYLPLTHRGVGVHWLQWLAVAAVALLGLAPVVGYPVSFAVSTVGMGVASAVIGLVDHVRLMTR